jgi:Phosphatidylethanolamine-binding protein
MVQCKKAALLLIKQESSKEQVKFSSSEAAYFAAIEHWIVYNIPAGARELEGNHPFTEGTTSFGFTGYGGPCPPPKGETHHYLFFTLCHESSACR